MADVATMDVTVAAIDEMEPIHGGLARRARATLGVSAWGMQVLTLPPGWDGYPEHNHDATAFDPNQEPPAYRCGRFCPRSYAPHPSSGGHT